MNERIKELAKQAAEYCKTQPREIVGTMWEEKFAELIVKECINIIPWQYESKIKQHFGVEEW